MVIAMIVYMLVNMTNMFWILVDAVIVAVISGIIVDDEVVIAFRIEILWAWTWVGNCSGH